MDNYNRTQIICYKQLMTIYFYRHNYAIITLYIHERPSSWSTLRIRPSWPQSRVRLNLLLALFLVCFGPPSIMLFTPWTCGSHSNPPLPAGQLNTSVQVNNMATLHHIYTVTHIYITFILLFISFFILLLLLWAGRLAQTLLVCHSTIVYPSVKYMYVSACKYIRLCL